MFRIDDNDNSIAPIESVSFSDLGYKEREHLQEWIAKNPDVFGEDLLIIQKEFSGFNETNERLDLLALDRFGNIVVIENKLDDSGKDVAWQVLKYAAYCSQLTNKNIIEIFQQYLDKSDSDQKAEDTIADFMEVNDSDDLQLNVGNTQRIILVAAKFRKEITATVLWLMNYGLRIQCFRVTPYVTASDRYIHFEQIIPIQDIEEYMITMADKAKSEVQARESGQARQHLLRAFWQKYIAQSNGVHNLYSNVSPSKDQWIWGSTGITNIGLNSVVSRNYARVEFYITAPDRDENKKVFDFLFSKKEEIEKAFGGELQWERLDARKASRIKSQLDGVSYADPDLWPTMIDFMVVDMERLIEAFGPVIEELKKWLPDYRRKTGP